MKVISTIPGSDVHSRANVLCRNKTTRIFHAFGGGVSRCGSSRKNLIASIDECQNAKGSMFCEKCFQNGKPEIFFEIDA